MHRLLKWKGAFPFMSAASDPALQESLDLGQS